MENLFGTFLEATVTGEPPSEEEWRNAFNDIVAPIVEDWLREQGITEEDINGIIEDYVDAQGTKTKNY